MLSHACNQLQLINEPYLIAVWICTCPMQVLRMYGEDLRLGFTAGCTAVQLAAENQAGVPPISDHVACFYGAFLIETPDLFEVSGPVTF